MSLQMSCADQMERVMYNCGKCCRWYGDYLNLVLHLYYVHGHESSSCPRCPMKVWSFAAHKCHVKPEYQWHSDSDDSGDEQGDTRMKSPASVASSSSSGIASGSGSGSEAGSSSTSAKYTNINNNDSKPATPATELYCYCRRGFIGQMIACEGEKCPYEWYHYPCVGVEIAPVGDWFCHLCL